MSAFDPSRKNPSRQRSWEGRSCPAKAVRVLCSLCSPKSNIFSQGCVQPRWHKARLWLLWPWQLEARGAELHGAARPCPVSALAPGACAQVCRAPRAAPGEWAWPLAAGPAGGACCPGCCSTSASPSGALQSSGQLQGPRVQLCMQLRQAWSSAGCGHSWDTSTPGDTCMGLPHSAPPPEPVF